LSCDSEYFSLGPISIVTNFQATKPFIYILNDTSTVIQAPNLFLNPLSMSFNDINREQRLASQFLISCGTVLLRSPLPPNTADTKVVLIRSLRGSANRKNIVLPKGRSEPGEPPAVTALRETQEETGYACELLPLAIPSAQPNVASVNTEPLAIQTRIIPSGQLKLVYFFAATTKGSMGEHSEEDQDYETIELSISEAKEKLTHKEDAQLVDFVFKLLLNRAGNL
jgi:8-oxo-dGTP pyrophosphatase MutT (NUDIX family)